MSWYYVSDLSHKIEFLVICMLFHRRHEWYLGHSSLRRTKATSTSHCHWRALSEPLIPSSHICTNTQFICTSPPCRCHPQSPIPNPPYWIPPFPQFPPHLQPVWHVWPALLQPQLLLHFLFLHEHPFFFCNPDGVDGCCSKFTYLLYEICGTPLPL